MVSTLTGMTVQAILHRYFPAVYLTLIALLGCVAGWLATVIFGFWLAAPVQNITVGQPSEQAVVQKRPLTDYQIILDRNIFNAAGAATTVLSEHDAAAAPVSSATPGKTQQSVAVAGKDFVLVGTIAAGRNSLAVLRQGKDTFIYRLGEEIGDGIMVKEISRNTVILAFRDGSRQVLTIANDIAPAAAESAPRQAASALAGNSKVKQVGENKWVIPKEVADQARGNVNELMKQARMEPRIVAGKTSGFLIRMIRPHSFLDQLGLRRGDVVMEVNNVPLDSPEKALQIFQQLREARNIKVDLLRHDRPITLEYETN